MESEQIFTALGRLEGKMDLVITSQTSTDNRIDKLEVRVTRNENYRSWITGAIATLGLVVTVAISWVNGVLHAR